MLRIYEEEIVRVVKVEQLSWPTETMAAKGFGENYRYEDLRGISWEQAIETIGFERELVEELIAAPGPDIEGFKELVDQNVILWGLDPGVAGAVMALSAAGCVTSSSCNGGCFGDPHHEDCPVIAFCARPWSVPVLLESAEAVGVGLVNGLEGLLLVYANDIRQMLRFAEELIRRAGAA